MISFNKKQNSGFTLVETLVAISILLLVITGPMVISMRTAKSTSFSSEQVQAFFLAQEGLELAQKVRDDLVLRSFLEPSDPNYLSNPWATITSLSGTFQNCLASTGCGLVWGSVGGSLENPLACSITGNCLLYLSDTGRAKYVHASVGNTVTPYTRKIYFDDVGGGGLRVRSEVTWRTGSLVAIQKVTTDTYLYNIYDRP
jgi:prepilin-type N-terminal cleavage/methylation domain-containing protein